MCACYVSGLGPDGGQDAHPTYQSKSTFTPSAHLNPWNPLVWLTNKHGATIFAVLVGGLIAYVVFFIGGG